MGEHEYQLSLRFDGPGDASDHLVSLRKALRDKSDLHGRKLELVPAPQKPGDMGGGFIELTVALASTASVRALIDGYWVWRRSKQVSVALILTNRAEEKLELTLANLGDEDYRVQAGMLTETVKEFMARPVDPQAHDQDGGE
ncbi:MAG: hypothetical protein HOV87_33095 [Catenulispora sp.]|nr:hypothetical protein [Catenulispora sp.]